MSAYFIADIGANHDGEFYRAVELMYLAKQAGADAVKFQHFLADRIVSKNGSRSSHQKGWEKSVYETYRDAELDRDWTIQLAGMAERVGVDFLSTPYDLEAVDQLEPLVPAFKIGSGDITWIPFLRYVASKGKPVILATGASEMWEVEDAVETILQTNPDLALLQCNTNYTGHRENFQYVNLRVLQAYRQRWPELNLGLSDHTPGHTTVLGAIAMGAKVIEKHFTDDTSREGPDHSFAMDPESWREMADRSRELEAALGDGVKRIEGNELETVRAQRRCVRAARPLQAGRILTEEDLVYLRPALPESIPPSASIVGCRLCCTKGEGEPLFFEDLILIAKSSREDIRSAVGQD